MPRLMTAALIAPILAACALPHQGNAMPIADLPVAVVSHDIFLDGGSVELTVRDAAGNERRYLRNHSLDSQGTAALQPNHRRKWAHAHHRRTNHPVGATGQTTRTMRPKLPNGVG